MAHLLMICKIVSSSLTKSQTKSDSLNIVNESKDQDLKIFTDISHERGLIIKINAVNKHKIILNSLLK